MRIACGLIMPMELRCIIEVIKSEFAQFMADECSQQPRRWKIESECVFIIIPSLTLGSAAFKNNSSQISIVKVAQSVAISREPRKSRGGQEWDVTKHTQNVIKANSINQNPTHRPPSRRRCRSCTHTTQGGNYCAAALNSFSWHLNKWRETADRCAL